MNRDQVESAQNACNLALSEAFIGGSATISSSVGGGGAHNTDSNGCLKFGKLLLQLNSLLKLATDKNLIEREFFSGRDVTTSIRDSVRAKKLETHLQSIRQQQHHHHHHPLLQFPPHIIENLSQQQPQFSHHQMLAFHSALLRLNQMQQQQQQQHFNHQHHHYNPVANELAARLNEHFLRLSSSSSSSSSFSP